MLHFLFLLTFVTMLQKQTTTQVSKTHSTLDRAGILVSILCAIHCFSVPIILTGGFFGSLGFVTNPQVEFLVLGTSFVLACLSLIPNFLKRHRNPFPILMVIAGFSLILLNHDHGSLSWKVLVSVVGGLLIGLSHFLNLKITARALLLPLVFMLFSPFISLVLEHAQLQHKILFLITS